MTERVVFFPANDWSSGSYLAAAFERLSSENFAEDINSINDAIELYHIEQYASAEMYLKSWDSEICKKFSIIGKSLAPLYYKYFNKEISGQSIKTTYDEVIIDYHQSFWFILQRTKTYTRIFPSAFSELLNEYASSSVITNILRCPEIVSQFQNEICCYLKASPESAEVLYYNCSNDKQMQPENLKFPKALSDADVELILSNYINSDRPNTRTLKYIETYSTVENHSVPAIIRQKARFRRKEIENEMLTSGVIFTTTTQITFKPGMKECKEFKRDGKTFLLNYNLSWLEDNLDMPTILNNFIYLFEFTDLNGRINLISKPSDLGVFERAMIIHSDRFYVETNAFREANQIAVMQLVMYKSLLEKHEIFLNDIIEWFFKDYLREAFSVNGFILSMPSMHTSFHEKCAIIVTCIEFVILQFSMWVQTGAIDLELIQMSEQKIDYQKIPSTVNGNNIYGMGGNFNRACYLLFSDQCMLTYPQGQNIHGNNFYNVCNGNIVRNGFYRGSQLEEVDWLYENGLLTIDNKGKISTTRKAAVLLTIHQSDYVPYWAATLSKKDRDIIDMLLIDRWLEKESGLLSRHESSYFNYYLNKREFDNGPDLRDKYAHGVNYANSEEEFHKHNYYELLKIMLLLVIKINYDFVYKEKSEASGNAV